MENLGLNERNQGIVKSYMKFAKYQRSENLKFLEMSFQDITSSLSESTYTKDEVLEILSNLKDLISSEVNSEMIDVAHTNVLLFAQLLTQADKWHLQMNVDFSEIQNRELLSQVKIMEDDDPKVRTTNRLQPLENSGASELLRIEIDKLREENCRLESESKILTDKLEEICNEKERIKEICDAREEEMNVLRQKTDQLAVSAETLQSEISKSDSEQLLGEYEKVLSEQLSLELESMRQEYLGVQSQLTLAEQELERKFNQTTAYSNMKTMIAKKNDQVKELRNQLLKYQKNPDEEQK